MSYRLDTFKVFPACASIRGMKTLIFTFVASIFVATAATAQDEYTSIIEPGIYAEHSCSDETGISIFVAGRNISFASESFVFVSKAMPLSAVLAVAR
jgi:hypothetical protein